MSMTFAESHPSEKNPEFNEFQAEVSVRTIGMNGTPLRVISGSALNPNAS